MQSKIEDLKILIDDIIVIHTLNNLNSQFCPYLIMLSHEKQQKPNFLYYLKSSENKELRLKNKSIVIVNFVIKAKLKSASYGNHKMNSKKLIKDLDQKKENSKI